MRYLFFIICVLPFSCTAQENKTYSDPYKKVEIIGGLDSLRNSLKELPSLKECDTQGSKSFIRVLVNELGVVDSLEVIKSSCPEADSIAIRIVRDLKFRAASYNGKPQKSFYIIPIKIGP